MSQVVESSGRTGTDAASGRATTCAVIVTHNRKEWLRRSIVAVLAQTRPVEHVVVVDNASTDGSADIVRSEFPLVDLLQLPDNVGGAGGFHRGMRHAHSIGYDWLWLMDDDTIPDPGALERLLEAEARAPDRPILLASRVVWRDGRLHPMNEPAPRWNWPGRLALAADARLVLLRNATFVSVLIRGEAIERFGLPLAHYFIWGDDVEYTSRLLKHGIGYLVPESRVLHDTKSPHTSLDAAPERFYYHVRNGILFVRGSGLTIAEKAVSLRFLISTTRRFLQRNRKQWRAYLQVLRATLDGLRGEVR